MSERDTRIAARVRALRGDVTQSVYRIGYTARLGVVVTTASPQVRRGGAGGARTRDPGIMSPRAPNPCVRGTHF